MSGPLVSVLVPAFNASRYVLDALASVDAQTHRRIEVFVWDDGSSDDTSAVVQTAVASRDPRRPLKLLAGPHAGVSHARNGLMAAATGTVFAFLDADDLWLPHHLETALAAMRQGQRKAYTVSQAEHFAAPGESWMTDEELATLARPLSTLVVRAEDARAAGGFDEALAVAEDFDFFQRLEDRGVERVLLDTVTARRRIHPENTVHRLRRSRGGELLKMLHKSIKRQKRE